MFLLSFFYLSSMLLLPPYFFLLPPSAFCFLFFSFFYRLSSVFFLPPLFPLTFPASSARFFSRLVPTRPPLDFPGCFRRTPALTFRAVSGALPHSASAGLPFSAFIFFPQAIGATDLHRPLYRPPCRRVHKWRRSGLERRTSDKVSGGENARGRITSGDDNFYC